MGPTKVIFLLFYDALLIHATKTETPTGEPEANLEPLIFFYDPKELFLVRILWNPTLDIDKVLELAQREVSYAYDSFIDGPAPTFQPWRVLVREADRHNSSSRYAFVKDDQCKELDFKVSWKNTKGFEMRDVIQTLKALPISQDMEASVSLRSMIFDTENQAIKVDLDWSVDLSQWERIMIGEAKPILRLEKCLTLFLGLVDPPTILDGGRSVYFDSAYAHHNCSFSIRISFETFDNQSDCYATYQSSEKESLTLDLSCDAVPGLACPQKPFGCDMDCTPLVMTEPHFELDGNKTKLSVKVSWSFLSAAHGRTVKQIKLRYFHSWLKYHNLAFDIENMTMANVPRNRPSFVLLPSLSITAQAMWVIQICQQYETCKLVKWSDAPAYPIAYYQYASMQPVSALSSLSSATSTEPSIRPMTDLNEEAEFARNISAVTFLPENAAILAEGKSTAPTMKANPRMLWFVNILSIYCILI